MSPDALHCLFVTLAGYESLKGQVGVKRLLPRRGGELVTSPQTLLGENYAPITSTLLID